MVIAVCRLAVVLIGSYLMGHGLEIVPTFLRLELANSSQTTITFAVSSAIPATILAAESNCRCLAVTTPLPIVIPAGGTVTLTARVAAMQAGVERVVLRTTAGFVQAEVQVVTGSIGVGRDILLRALTLASSADERVIIIAHDLLGQVRNCGCSHGPLGGIDHLAALPAWCKAHRPQVPVTCILTGNSEGLPATVDAEKSEKITYSPTPPEFSKPSIQQALLGYGWIHDSLTVLVVLDPIPFLVIPGVIAIVTPRTIQLNHRRLVHPVGDGGMTAMVLRVNAQLIITEQIVLPIDASLPADAGILANFPDHLSASIVGTATSLTESCSPCHRTATAAWKDSPHARAWQSLKPADLVDGCVTCHSTAASNQAAAHDIVTSIACQACHQSSEPHRLSGGMVRTAGTADCRGCHATHQDPGFVREHAWPFISHGKDVSIVK